MYRMRYISKHARKHAQEVWARKPDLREHQEYMLVVGIYMSEARATRRGQAPGPGTRGPRAPNTHTRTLGRYSQDGSELPTSAAPSAMKPHDSAQNATVWAVLPSASPCIARSELSSFTYFGVEMPSVLGSMRT